jgi:hypothetical protein
MISLRFPMDVLKKIVNDLTSNILDFIFVVDFEGLSILSFKSLMPI